ncbi:MAG: hypothetical protein [Siphoviridae sp. ctdEk19]|nr:MAG: hypothetical protein [Siphoviridae sp. ctdEk19]
MAETVYETVKMQDERVVDFPGKTRLLKTSYQDDQGRLCVRLDWRNGETRVFAMQESLKDRFALHGAEQKLGDETAGVKELDDAILAVDELIDRLAAGEWGTKREASGFAGASILLRALVEATGKTTEEARDFLKGRTQAEKMALRNSGRLKPIVDRLEAEKASKGQKVDTDALLDSFETGEGDASEVEGEGEGE